MTESEPPPPPAPPPPDDGFPPSLFSSLLEDEEEAAEDMGWGGGDHHHVNWKQRYYQLNVSLARFRMETAELQRSLQEKVSLEKHWYKRADNNLKKKFQLKVRLSLYLRDMGFFNLLLILKQL